MPLRASSASWVATVSIALAKSGSSIFLPGGRAIFLMLLMTSAASPAFLSTSIAVLRSVKASTPVRR